MSVLDTNYLNIYLFALLGSIQESERRDRCSLATCLSLLVTAITIYILIIVIITLGKGQ